MKSFRRRLLVLACCLQTVGFTVHAGQNCIAEGSDFEASLNGFQVKPLLFLQNYGTLVAPQIDPSTAMHGQRSLKLTNASRQDSFRIISQSFPIPSEGTGSVTLSFYGKSDPAGVPVIFIMGNGYDKPVLSEANLESGWKRFQVNKAPEPWFNSDGEAAKGRYYVELRVFSPSPWKNVWIDGIQLEEGGLSDYNNPAPVDLAFEMDRDLKVYHPGETPKLVLTAAGKGVAGTGVKVQFEEMFSGRKDAEETIQLAADGDADHAMAVIPLKPQPRGLYRISARTADGKGVQYQVYGVIEPMGGRPKSARSFFGGSIENIMPLAGSPGLPGTREHSICAWSRDPDKLLALARDIGWGWWHAYNAFSINTIQPNSSREFRWLDSDYLADLAKKHDFDVYSNWMGHGGRYSSFPPAWIRSAAVCKGGADNRGKGEQLVDVKKMEESTRAIVDRYKAVVRAWEPWNEPGTKMREDEYLPIQQAVYRGAKAADPTCRIFCLCGTYDAGGDLYGWVKTCLKMGAADSMDGIAIHGYHVRDRDYVDKVRQFTKAAIGKELSIVDSESGNELSTLYPKHVSAFRSEGASIPPDAKAHIAVSHLANILTHGAERQSWFNLIGYGEGINYHSYSLLEFDGSPSMSLIASNTFIDRIGLGKFKEEVAIGGDVVIYVFEVEGKGVAMLWADAKPQVVEIPLKPEQVVCENLAGQDMVVAACPTGLSLPVAKKLCYLIANDLDGEQFAQALRKACIPSLQSVEITRVGIAPDEKKRPALSITLKGKSPVSQFGGIELLKTPKEWQMEKDLTDFQGVGMDQEKRFLFPITAGLEKGVGDSVQIGLDGDKGMITYRQPLRIWAAAPRKGEVKLDGNVQEWNPASFRPLEPWVSAAIQWDNRGLWVAAKVQDATPRNFQEAAGKEAWQSDSLELFFNPAIEDSYKDRRIGPGDCQVICSVRGGGDSKDAVDAQGGPAGINKTLDKASIKMVSQRDADGYAIEIFVPWSNFPGSFMPAPGSFLGFDLSVRDVDRDFLNVKRVIWAGDNDDYQFTDKFGVLVLAP